MKKINFVKKNKTLMLTTTALFLALGVIFPLAFHSLGLGTAFSPMHLPVMLCGLICGGLSGCVVGFLTPFLGSFLNQMPPIFPNAVAMSFELAAYGFVIGVVFDLLKKLYRKKNKATAVSNENKDNATADVTQQNALLDATDAEESGKRKNKKSDISSFFGKTAYVWAMLAAMLLGRMVYGLAMWICLAIGGNGYTLAVFLTKAFVDTFPAVILQLITIPLVMITLDKTHVLDKYDTAFATTV